MKIAITGTPGTGKTKTSQELSKLINYNILDINEYSKTHNLIKGKDKKRKCTIIDEKKIKKESEKIEENTIIEGHLSHYCKVDLIIVLRTHPKELKKRLQSRNWPEEKIKENIESEILDIILIEAYEKNKNTYELETTKSTPKKIAKKIKQLIEKKDQKKLHKPGKININWDKYL